MASVTTDNAASFFRFAGDTMVPGFAEHQPGLRDQEQVPLASSTLSNGGKEALKLAKRLREIMALEALGALQRDQQEKVASKAGVAAAFLTAVESLPPGSAIIAKVQ